VVFSKDETVTHTKAPGRKSSQREREELTSRLKARKGKKHHICKDRGLKQMDHRQVQITENHSK